MMKLLVVFSLCFSLISALSLNPDTSRIINKLIRFQRNGRIVGGAPAKIEDHPWQVAFYDTGFFFCGGVILNPRWILTAAHCVDDEPPIQNLHFNAGHAYRDSGIQLRVMHYELHEDYVKPDFSYDVAITLLYEAVPLGPTIYPIPLAPEGYEAPHGSEAKVTGWGYLANGELPLNLHEVDVPIVGRSQCEEKWPGFIDDTMMCAGAIGKDSCGGDSGSALVAEGELIGIVSWGPNTCGSDRPGVYTKVTNPEIHHWITDRTL